MLIGLLLPEDHPWRDAAASLGTIACDGALSDLASAARAPLDLLLVDAADCAPDGLDALRAYRIARPHTRIVVSLPADAQPGSPVLAGLVAMGIYDLAPGSTALPETLAQAPTYADAARWALADFDQATGRSRAVQVRERVVERQVAVSQRPVLVVVGGSGYGVGTTTLAVSVARHLGLRGQRTLALDLAAVPGLIHLAGGEDFEEYRALGPLTDAVRLHPDGERLPARAVLALLRARGYTYLVCDIGMVGERDGAEELLREADLSLIALPGQPHRRVWWEEYLRHRPPASARHVVVGADAADGALVAAAFQEAFGTRVLALRGGDGHRPQQLPPQGQGREAALDALLAEVLPHGGRPPARLGDRLRRTAYALLYRLDAPRRGLRSAAEAAGAVFGRLIGGALVLAVAAGACALILLLGGGAMHQHLAGALQVWLAAEGHALAAWLR